jgi:hypothetical protein
MARVPVLSGKVIVLLAVAEDLISVLNPLFHKVKIPFVVVLPTFNEEYFSLAL